MELFVPAFDYFSEKNYRVIAFDHIGCGLSDKPQEISYRLSDHIDHMDQLIGKLKLNSVSIVMHDWGGAIAMGWATRNTHRVNSLIITNTAAFNSKEIPKRIALLKVPKIGSYLIRRFNAFAFPALYMASAKGLSGFARRGLLKPYKSYASRQAIAQFVADIPLSKKHPTYDTLEQIEVKLKDLKCPKLILWGMKDFCFHSGFLKRWKSLYPMAQVKTFAQAGHYLFEDEPKSIYNAVLGFLKSHECSRKNNS